MRRWGHVEGIGEMETAGILTWKPESKRPLGRPNCRREDKLKWTIKK
jgi:hypothetical protein